METIKRLERTSRPQTSTRIIVADKDHRWVIWHRNGEYAIDVSHGPTGKRLDVPVSIRLSAQWSEADLGVAQYIIQSLSGRQSGLISFVLGQRTIFKVARHLQRSGTGSLGSVVSYADVLNRLFQWLHQTPDKVAAQLLNTDGSTNYHTLKAFKEQLEDYVGTLQARGLAPKTIHLRLTALKTWMKVNDIPTVHIELPKLHVVYEDRAPTPEELMRLLEVADIRGKVVVSLQALGGFREHTLVKLRYRHIRHSLEKGDTPLWVHVPAELNKGKYADYDTFLGREGVDYLKLYLDLRRRGSPSGKIPPEAITDDSPLIRDERHIHKQEDTKILTATDVKPLRSTAVYDIVYSLCVKAGLIEPGKRRHWLRAHSLRKYFRTQLTALGVQTDYIDYMMGHVISTYHTVKMKGVEFLRGIYACSGLSIRPQTKASKLDMIKTMIRAAGEDPEQILTREFLSTPNRTYVIGGDGEQDQLKVLYGAFKDLMRKELGTQSS